MRASGSEAAVKSFAGGLAVTPALSLLRGEVLGRRLAPRERETLRAYARTGDMRAVAALMGISLQTAKNHSTKAYHKLDVTNCIDAFRVLGWLHVPEVAA